MNGEFGFSLTFPRLCDIIPVYWENELPKIKISEVIMRLDGFGLFVEDMGKMIRFYRDVLGFEIKEDENTSNVYLLKDGTLFLLYGRKDFEKMTNRKYEYLKGVNGHFELALYVDTYEEVDKEYERVIGMGAEPILEPTTEPWGQRTCYIADPEGNLIEIGSFNRPFQH
jgi:catechol 2,3-dioxygenase-like lactoylglutathione lyase family enzyme